MSACTCAACGREFTGLTPFDKHQDVDYSLPVPIVCLDPAQRGMARNKAGRWGFPLTEAGRRRLASLAASEA